MAADSANGVIVLLVLWAVFGAVGGAIGASKGRQTAGWVLGLLLGFIGWIIVACMSPTPEKIAQQHVQIAATIAGGTAGGIAATAAPGTLRKCPSCAERIQREAIVCRFCGRDVDPLPNVELEKLPPEGWYPDPLKRDEARPDRWFDGKIWTQWLRDRPGGGVTEDAI